MSDLFGNHIVGFPTRRLIFFFSGLSYNWVTKQLCWSQIQPDGVFIRDQEANIMTIKQNDGTKHPKEPVFVQYAMYGDVIYFM